jgi:hypothetical protein
MDDDDTAGGEYVDEEVVIVDEIPGIPVHIHVYSADQFWQGKCDVTEQYRRQEFVLLTGIEIEAILVVPPDCNLTQLDNTLRMFVTFCAAYHGESSRVLLSPLSLSPSLSRIKLAFSC